MFKIGISNDYSQDSRFFCEQHAAVKLEKHLQKTQSRLDFGSLKVFSYLSGCRNTNISE